MDAAGQTRTTGEGDARAAVRTRVSLLARFGRTTGTGLMDGVCTNLSRGGVFIGTRRPLNQGDQVRIDCEPYDRDGRIRGVARVVWRRAAAEAGKPAGMGLRFIELQPGASALISQLLRHGAPHTADVERPSTTATSEKRPAGLADDGHGRGAERSHARLRLERPSPRRADVDAAAPPAQSEAGLARVEPPVDEPVAARTGELQAVLGQADAGAENDAAQPGPGWKSYALGALALLAIAAAVAGGFYSARQTDQPPSTDTPPKGARGHE